MTLADTLTALLAVHGPSTVDALAARAGRSRWRVRGRLWAMWDEHLVSVSAGRLWRLTEIGRARAEQLTRTNTRTG